MTKGDDRSRFEHAARQHMIMVKTHPEWMGRAVQALAPWNSGDLTMQHAVANALREAYAAGKRGDPIEPIDFFDVYADPEPPAPPARRTRTIVEEQPGPPAVRRIARGVAPVTPIRIRRS